ncbi:hypothetical protein ABOONEI_392 [Aciduliprofundum boonei T469]|nr:hypothetical protein ABOONEI_392 [Aciduliprofundum boonei T469]
MNVLQVIGAVLMLFFLPGYTFINMLFPKKGELDLEYDQLYRIGLGMGMSIVIAILTGYILGYTSLFYGKYIWFALINLTGIFFIVGFYRGGYPTLRKLFGLEDKDKYDRLIMLNELLKERKRKIKELEEVEKMIRLNPRRRDYYEEKRREILEEIREMDDKIERLKGVVNEV